ncbi:MAG: hypothetical protein ACK543_08735, partial [Acidovorax sp.]
WQVLVHMQSWPVLAARAGVKPNHAEKLLLSLDQAQRAAVQVAVIDWKFAFCWSCDAWRKN